MMKLASSLSLRRRMVLASLPILTLAGAAMLWAAFPTGVQSVTLSTPPQYPCTTVGGCTYSTTSYTTALFNGTVASGGVGGGAMTSGDFDGDGRLDLAIGQPAMDSGKGRVYVIYSTATTPTGTISLSSAVVITGAVAGDNLGASLASGRLSGVDSRDELVIGAPGASSGTGVVYVIPGSATKMTSTSLSSAYKITGEAAGHKVGTAVAVGDVSWDNGAYKPDLLIGAPGASKAYLITAGVSGNVTLPGSGIQIFTGTAGDGLGTSVAMVGDVDFTSSIAIGDLALGAPLANSGAGALYVLGGRIGFANAPGTIDVTTSTTLKRTFVGDLRLGNPGTLVGDLGAAVAGPGDINGDGVTDIVVGAPKAPVLHNTNPSSSSTAEAGRLYLLFGAKDTFFSTNSTNISNVNSYYYGDKSYDHLGASISAAGDVDDDNLPDFLAGAPDEDGVHYNTPLSHGAAYLFAGKGAGWPTSGIKIAAGATIIRFATGVEGDQVGKLVYGSSSLDLDGDGHGDFFIGAPGVDVSASNNEGRLYYYAFGDFYDQDGDNQSRVQGDCDEDDPNVKYSVNGTGEICDNKDNDCDGKTDDADDSVTERNVYYRDADGDGYGGYQTTETCAATPPAGYEIATGDCNDNASAINPSAQEVCNGYDDDCDGKTDADDPTITGLNTYYRDADGDGYGISSTTIQACSQTTGYASVSGDCNDGNKNVNPAAQEACNGYDDDCDAKIDDDDDTITGQQNYCVDSDQDGYGNKDAISKACTPPGGTTTVCTDCKDNSASINPGASEICDSVDNDCDGTIDESGLPYYVDSDGDTFGAKGTTPVYACPGNAPTGRVTNDLDCNDNNTSIKPTAQEACDSLDNDCDGAIDDADTNGGPVQGTLKYYVDADGDGYGSTTVSAEKCPGSQKPPGTSLTSDDCNDSNAAVRPGATEQCNGYDDDCDGKTDDADDPVSNQKVYYQDADGDGHGNPSAQVKKCSETPPGGTVAAPADDCDDGNNKIHPGAAEGTTWNSTLDCDNGDTYDNNCDGRIDEGTCKFDDDDDDFTEEQGDCDDTDDAVSPGSPEVCDAAQKDNNCDGKDQNDELFDRDGDGHLSSSECSGTDGRAEGDDCDDTEDTTFTGASELCDAVDQDCDNKIDDGFVDADGDSYYSGTLCKELFADPAHASLEPDCNDADLAIHPGAEEVCDGVDNNCDGRSDEEFPDLDLDLIADCADTDDDGDEFEEGEDCDDRDASIKPGASELCDGIDNNCNGIEDDPTDVDDDSFVGCDDGHEVDCDDSNPDTYPDAEELCDGQDNDCDKLTPVDEEDTDGDLFRVCDNDCDDGDIIVNPNALEVCDELDNNCDGAVNEGLLSTWFSDQDGDGEGDAASSLEECAQPDGYVDNAEDCNDQDGAVHTGATEVLGDGIDNNCDGSFAPFAPDDDVDIVDAAVGCACATPGGGPVGGGSAAWWVLGAPIGFLLRRRARGQ